ncbi:MAG TPA: hypothetical protein VL974_07440 [Magnetospirillum sp.]|nr:hypothetical protein [Magnetospirillum sp.]
MGRDQDRLIVDAVLAGIADAKHTFAAWTRNVGYFAWAPEYLITVSVAKAVWEWCAPLSVWPEYRLVDAMREAGVADARLDGNRRADLLLYREGARPHAVVEVKRNVEGWGRIATDVERLRTMVAGARSSFQLAIVAFNCTLLGTGSAKGGAVLKDRLSRMAEAADELSLPGWSCGLTARGVNWDGHEYWSAAAVVLRRDADASLPSRSTHRPCTRQRAQVLSPT